MTEEIKKDKFWLIAVMNGKFSIVTEENGEPKKYYSFRDAKLAAAEKAKEHGIGVYGLVFNLEHAEQSEMITKTVNFKSIVEVGSDD